MLRDVDAPAWMTPALKQCFVISYVLLAPVVGAFADSMPKGRVMLLTNGVKICGCALMLFTVHPLAAYALVGLGAAAYSPAKYGILTELLPSRQLVVANGWIEGTTVASIILGVLLGGLLITGPVSGTLLAIDAPVFLGDLFDRLSESAHLVVRGLPFPIDGCERFRLGGQLFFTVAELRQDGL